jgi:hypothetical protein
MSDVSAEQCLLLDTHRYHAHPHLAVLESGTWLLVANRGPRRVVTMHPPQDPEYINILMRSTDEGRTWSPPAVVPAYGWTGVECAGLTPLGGGTVLLHQWRFRWYNSAAIPTKAEEPLLVGPDELMTRLLASREIADPAIAEIPPDTLMPWARGGGTTWAHISTDEGLTWSASVEIDTTPFSGGYGMRGAVVVDGQILLPLSDVPHWRRLFLVRSSDGGLTWSPPEILADAVSYEFEEPSIIALRDGSLLLLMRENCSRSLYSMRSFDNGKLWSEPVPTGILCYPAHLVMMPDGHVAAVTGRRFSPYGIVVYVFDQQTATWDVEHPIDIRSDLPNKDLGYPTAAVRADGTLYVAYYYRNSEGITGLYANTLVIRTGLAKPVS